MKRADSSRDPQKATKCERSVTFVTGRRRHPAYLFFLILMALILLIGVGLMIWGASQHNVLPDVLPGTGLIALGGCHG